MTNRTICAYPWVHMAAHLDGEMIICCNTHTKGNIKKDDGSNWTLKDIEDPLVYFNSNDYKKNYAESLKIIKKSDSTQIKEFFDITMKIGDKIKKYFNSIYSIYNNDSCK